MVPTLLPADERTSALLAPVRGVLDRALVEIGAAEPLRVRVAELAGVYTWQGDEVLLSSGLLGPGLHHPGEQRGPIPPLDRWRRAAGSVLEGAALRELARRHEGPPGTDWRWVGAAIFVADRAAPELGLADPELAFAVAGADPGSSPRAGFAALRAWEALGDDPVRRALGPPPTAEAWLAVGRWVLAAEGGRAALPVPVARRVETDVPVQLDAWSWRVLRIPAHPRGGYVEVEGDGAVEDPWACADRELITVAAAARTPCQLTARAGGPVGRWDVGSAEGFGQVFGARGVRFELHADGRLAVVLADAFVGPPHALSMAGQVGTSGIADGRWRVVGPSRLGFSGLASPSLTLHSRRGERFALPAAGFGMGEWLKAMVEAPWTWQVDGDHLVLRGRITGADVEVRLHKT